MVAMDDKIHQIGKTLKKLQVQNTKNILWLEKISIADLEKLKLVLEVKMSEDEILRTNLVQIS